MFGARTGVTRSFPYSPCLLAGRTNYINASALMRRADFLELGGYAEELAGNTHEDWDLWLRMLEHGKRGTYVRAPLLRWRRHEAGSRNVQDHARLARSLEVIRARHRPLLESLRGARGRLAYWSELAVATADVALGLSRSARVVRALEGHAWRRFRRRYQGGLERLPDEVGKQG
jgi:Glycosyltransferase like family 2